jgi:hypothetical protein
VRKEKGFMLMINQSHFGKFAIAIGVEPAFLSKVERDIVSPPSEG